MGTLLVSSCTMGASRVEPALVAEAFERLMAEPPPSPLADDAERAGDYRRRMERRERLLKERRR